MSVHRGGRGFGHLVRISGAPIGLGGVGLATPILYNSSALGAAPLVLAFDWTAPGTDSVSGYRGQLQIDGNSDFSSPEQNIVFLLDTASVAGLSESIGLATPSGLYNARLRILRDNESGATTVTDQLGNTATYDASAWSAPFSDTIIVATTQLSTTNKSQYVTPSGTPKLHFVGTGGVGAAEEVFADTVKTGGIRVFELTLTTWSGTNTVMMGFDDGALTGTQNFKEPGKTAGVPGCCSLWAGGVGSFYKNGAVDQSSPANGGYAQGDTMTCVIDQTVPTAVTAKFYRTRAGVTVQIGTTVTGITGLSGGVRPCVAPYQGDTGDVNFGQTAFARTLGGSEVMFG